MLLCLTTTFDNKWVHIWGKQKKKHVWQRRAVKLACPSSLMTKSYFMRGLSSLNEYLQFVRVQNMTKTLNYYSQCPHVVKIQNSNFKLTAFVLRCFGFVTWIIKPRPLFRWKSNLKQGCFCKQESLSPLASIFFNNWVTKWDNFGLSAIESSNTKSRPPHSTIVHTRGCYCKTWA